LTLYEVFMAAIQFGDYVSGQYAHALLATAGLIGVFPLASEGVSPLPWPP
jgi:hypothetical protein